MKAGRFMRVVALAWLTFSGLGLADARTDFLMRMLQTSAQFRVRAQAALALGGLKSDPSVTAALSGALKDEHPAVRAASAAALERLKDPGALVALKAAQNDGDGAVRTAVRSAIKALEPASASIASAAAASSSSSSQPTFEPSGGPSTYYVGVGVPGGGQLGLSSDALRRLRTHIERNVSQLSGVKVAPEGEARHVAEQVLGAERLVGYYVDSSVTSIEVRPDGSVRAQVSVALNTYPDRNLRAMLSGAATLSGGGQSEEAKVQAIEAAYVGALRRLPQAMQAGLARR